MDYVEEFKRYLREDGKRDSTILSYVSDVQGFLVEIRPHFQHTSGFDV